MRLNRFSGRFVFAFDKLLMENIQRGSVGILGSPQGGYCRCQKRQRDYPFPAGGRHISTGIKSNMLQVILYVFFFPAVLHLIA